MKDIETKINTLSEKIAEMRKKSESSTKTYAVIYIILVIAVFLYTSTIMSMIKEKTTADSISAQLRIFIDRDLLTEKNREKVLISCKKQAPALAEALVEMTHNKLIPTVEDKFKELIDTQVDGIITRLEKDVFPELSKVVKDHARELKKHSDVTDKKVADELAKILVKEFDSEMSKFINDKLRYRIKLLSEELEKISAKPYSQLTAKEAAERRLIINWIFLMEYHESPANVIGEMIKGINNTYEGILKDFQLKE